MNTTWEVADVRKPLISVTSLHLMRTRGSSAKNGDTIPLERTGFFFAVRLSIPKGFLRAGLNTNRIMKREPVRPHTEGRTRNTHTLSGLSLMLPTGSMLTWTSLLTLTDLEEKRPTQ